MRQFAEFAREPLVMLSISVLTVNVPAIKQCDLFIYCFYPL